MYCFFFVCVQMGDNIDDVLRLPANTLLRLSAHSRLGQTASEAATSTEEPTSITWFKEEGCPYATGIDEHFVEYHPIGLHLQRICGGRMSRGAWLSQHVKFFG